MAIYKTDVIKFVEQYMTSKGFRYIMMKEP